MAATELVRSCVSLANFLINEFRKIIGKKVFFFILNFVEQTRRRNECACVIQKNFGTINVVYVCTNFSFSCYYFSQLSSTAGTKFYFALLRPLR
jgi:hypothetical protein